MKDIDQSFEERLLAAAHAAQEAVHTYLAVTDDPVLDALFECYGACQEALEAWRERPRKEA